MLEKLVQQGAQSGREAVLFVVEYPEQIIDGTTSPPLVQRVRQSPLAGPLNTVGVDVLELFVCAGSKILMAVSMVLIEVPHGFVLEMFSRWMRVRFQHVRRYLRLFTQLLDTVIDYILTGLLDLSETPGDPHKDCISRTLSKHLCDAFLLLDSARHQSGKKVLA